MSEDGALTCGRCAMPIDSACVSVNVVTFPFSDGFGEALHMHPSCAEGLATWIVEQLEGIHGLRRKQFDDAERLVGIGHA